MFNSGPKKERSDSRESDDHVYLDYAATTPLDRTVFETMRPFFSEEFGNASSIHQFGQAAQQAVVQARQQTAEFLNCEPSEIIFNSGATEGNNTIIKGVGVSKKLAGGDLPHIIISQIEHDCVLAAAQAVEKQGFAEVTYLPVSAEGLVETEALKKAIRPNTVLISIMYANNEIGTVQPIEEIGKLLAELNKNRQNKIYFHTDAVQAANYLDCDVRKLGVDYLSLSAHKFYGPKGVGALFVRKGVPFVKFFDGGEQEFKMRAGTHNAPGIVGLGAAISMIKNNNNGEIVWLRDKLIDGVLKNIPSASLNGSRDRRLANNANFRFEGVEGESLVISLDLAGIAASTGSACAAKSLSPSHVLLALGLEHLQAHSSLRFSLGKYTTEKDIDKVLSVLPPTIEKLRGISGNLGEAAQKAELPKDFGC